MTESTYFFLDFLELMLNHLLSRKVAKLLSRSYPVIILSYVFNRFRQENDILQLAVLYQ